MRLRLLEVIPVLLLVLVAARTGTALALSGVVVDGEGLAVSGASVEITNEATGHSFRSDTTDAAGRYSVAIDDLATIVEGSSAATPDGFLLLPNYPNPFNPRTLIPFQLDRPSEVRLEVYNALGHLVVVLLEEERAAGSYEIPWNGHDGAGLGVAAGVYFYRLQAGSVAQTRKMLLLDGARAFSSRPAAKIGGGAQLHADLFSVVISGFDIETLTLRGQQIDQRNRLNFEVVRIIEPLVFDDPFLLVAVRRASQIAEGEITLRDVAGVTVLSEINSIVTSFEGIQRLTRLVELRFSLNRIFDLSPLAGLSNLRILSLGTNEISDITPLAGLTQLEFLKLDFNRIADLSPLAGLHNLRTLGLAHNPIESLEPISSLTALNTLILTQNRHTDIGALGSLEGLESLFLDRNLLRDLRPLNGLANLRELGISLNQVSDLTPLSHLMKLERLVANNNRISNLEPLASNLALTELHISNNGVTDLTELAHLTNLEVLNLSSNEISDLGPLTALTRLRQLNLSSNDITDLSPLLANDGIGEETVITLAGNPLSDLASNFQIGVLRQRGVDIFYESPLQ